jgi:hypothetical protein
MPRQSASSAQTKTIRPIGQSKIEGDFLRIAMGPGTLAEKAALIGMHKNTFDKERKKRADQIALQTRIELDESVHHAMRTLVELLDCDDPNARYKAAKDILDRAGFKPTDRIEVSAEVKRTPKEIEAEIRERMGDEIASRLLGVKLKAEDTEAPPKASPAKVEEAEDADWERVDG